MVWWQSDEQQSLSPSEPAQNLRYHPEVGPRVVSQPSGASDSLQSPDAEYQAASLDTNPPGHLLVQPATPASAIPLVYYQGGYDPPTTSLPSDNTPHDKQYQDATISSASQRHTITSANAFPIYNSNWFHNPSDSPQKAQPTFEDSSPSQSQPAYSVTHPPEWTSIMPQRDSYEPPTTALSPGDDVQRHAVTPLSPSQPPMTRTAVVKVIQMGRVAKDNVIRASFKRRRKQARYGCDIAGCGQTFTAQHNLTNHKNSHFDIRPHGCGKCGRSFVAPSDCKRHEKKCWT